MRPKENSCLYNFYRTCFMARWTFGWALRMVKLRRVWEGETKALWGQGMKWNGELSEELRSDAERPVQEACPQLGFGWQLWGQLCSEAKEESRTLIDWQKTSCFSWTRTVRGGDKNTTAQNNSTLILERTRWTGGWGASSPEAEQNWQWPQETCHLPNFLLVGTQSCPQILDIFTL